MCSEAVVHAINDALGLNMPRELLAASSSFGGGMSSGCVCGALVGGEIILGALLGREHPSMSAAEISKKAAALHDYFKEQNHSTCCRVLTRKGKDAKQCARFTECVAGKVIEMISEER